MLVGTLAALASPSSARAEDLFEVQVFHARVDPYEHAAIELHSTYAGAGASTTPPPEASTKGVLYELVEPTYGIAPGWEIGMHFQEAIRSDGMPVWGGARARVMTITRDESESGWHFGFNLEGGYGPPRFDADMWTVEARPIVEWTCPWLDLDLNPVLVEPLAGDHVGVPHFVPSFAARAVIAETLSPGLEYYGDLGPLTSMGPVASQRHYIFEAIDVVRYREWILHAGLGEGLTSASSKWIVTTDLGHIF